MKNLPGDSFVGPLPVGGHQRGAASFAQKDWPGVSGRGGAKDGMFSYRRR